MVGAARGIPALHAYQLANPLITASARPYNANYTAANLFDSGNTEYAALGQTSVSALFTTSVTDGTWVEFDFGDDVTFDRFVMVAQPNAVDQVIESRLIVSRDPVIDAGDTLFTFNPSGLNGAGLVRRLGTVSGRHARWEVTWHGAGALNLGAHQMWFLNSPPAALNAYTPFNANYAAAFAVDGDAGSAAGREYTSRGGGAGMFVDFDFRTAVAIAGFDYWNRWFDRVTTFDLIFADEPDFSFPLNTLSFTADPNGNQVNSATFEPVTARYVRLAATSTAGGANTDVREITFYTPQGQPPLVTQPTQGGVRFAGDAFAFTVAAGGDAPLSFKWWKDASAITGATNSSLTLTNLQESYSGS
jgi:hypothetical protein